MAGTYSYPIGSRDLDAGGRARVCAVGSMVLEAAGDDADTLGFGVDDLRRGICRQSGADFAPTEACEREDSTERTASTEQRGGAKDAPLSRQTWVLSRVALELERLPVRGETLDIYTWVSDYGRLMTTRNMDFAPFGFAVTQWVMIDLSTRRPLDLSALANKGASLVDREPPIEPPRRIPALDRAATSSDSDQSLRHPTPPLGVPNELRCNSKTILYSDIDFNGHVNSMKYLEWMIDRLSAEELEALAPSPGKTLRIDINYLHEALPGQRVEIHHTTTDFDIRNSEDVSICRAIFSTKSR